VPPSALVYIYADTMNDFNYYMRREVMPVLRTRSEVERLLAEGAGAYMLIKANDLKRLRMITPERIRITGAVGDTLWNLVALGSPPNQ
jgi:hypothetical protein